MLARLVVKPNMIRNVRMMSNFSKTMSTGIVKTMLKLLGFETRGGVEPLCVGDLCNGSLITTAYKPKGTVLRWTETDKESQINAYDPLIDEMGGLSGFLITACALRPYWFDVEYEKVHEKLEGLKAPFVVSYMFTEIGNYVPAESQDENLVHAGTVQVLGIE
jgi:hypothetical protein